MNTIDVLKYSEFPISSETLQFMQSMLLMSAKVASLGGQSYILDGCVDNGQSVTAGTVVINGEILPFDGGAKTTYVVIAETKTSVQVYDTTYDGLYTNRKVIFGSGAGQVAWSSVKRITDIVTLSTQLQALNEAFTTHTANHTVDWTKVLNKPASFPPSAHTHPFDSITDKPATYPPSAHTHLGLVVYAGEFNVAGSTVTRLFGTLNVYVSHLAGGRYQLTHGIGHTNYIVLGVGIGNDFISLRTMTDIQENTVQVNVSDDGTGNDYPIRFVIITFA